MTVTPTPADLRALTQEIAALFAGGRVRAPVHLAGGCEDLLCAYFATHYAPGDWVLSTWRASHHALLAGVPKPQILRAILAGRSIALAFPEHRFLASAIVGGCLPIALGLALAAKRQQLAGVSDAIPYRTHVFCGDMAARTGAYHETAAYARAHALPLSLIVEDNGLSVATPTAAVWPPPDPDPYASSPFREHHYVYRLPFPHAGVGTRINF